VFFRKKLMFVCGRSEQYQHLWRHFRDMNLSKNSGVLQLVGRVACGINRVRFWSSFFEEQACIFFTGILYECLQLKQATGRPPGEQQKP
jgi:hypothetical protein